MNLASRAALGLRPLLIALAAVASMANNPDGQQATPGNTVVTKVVGLSLVVARGVVAMNEPC